MLIVGFLSLWSFPMFAQLQPTEIKVIDAENGNSIEFATVQWKGLNAPTYTNSTTTNRKGIAKLSASSNQKLMLMVSYVGYQTITDTITANGKRYTIRLLPESTELADVVVVGKTRAQILRESPEAVSVIRQSIILIVKLMSFKTIFMFNMLFQLLLYLFRYFFCSQVFFFRNFISIF